MFAGTTVCIDKFNYCHSYFLHKNCAVVHLLASINCGSVLVALMNDTITTLY